MTAFASDGVSATSAAAGLPARTRAPLPVDRTAERNRARERAARRRRRDRASEDADATPLDTESDKGRRIDVRV